MNLVDWIRNLNYLGFTVILEAALETLVTRSNTKYEIRATTNKTRALSQLASPQQLQYNFVCGIKSVSFLPFGPVS